MKCKNCGADSAVYDSRLEATTNCIYRRRRCNSCGAKWTTQELFSTMPWLSARPCEVDGCGKPCDVGRKKCRYHIKAKRAEKDKQIREDLVYKQRVCKNHPHRLATTKTTTLKCIECWRAYRAGIAKANRKRRRDDAARAASRAAGEIQEVRVPEILHPTDDWDEEATRG